jgi:hypothetical protein
LNSSNTAVQNINLVSLVLLMLSSIDSNHQNLDEIERFRVLQRFHS